MTFISNLIITHPQSCHSFIPCSDHIDTDTLSLLIDILFTVFPERLKLLEYLHPLTIHTLESGTPDGFAELLRTSRTL
jgi:hypothetical protein